MDYWRHWYLFLYFLILVISSSSEKGILAGDLDEETDKISPTTISTSTTQLITAEASSNPDITGRALESLVDSVKTASIVENEEEKEVINEQNLTNLSNNTNHNETINETVVINITDNSTILMETSIKDEEDDLKSNFLSFEEWVQKKINLTDNKNSKLQTKPSKHNIENREYSIGEENEIDFDIFSNNDINEPTELKNRFNFASLDCAATIIKTNDGAKGASSILLENKESYLLNQCNVKENFIIVELCEDILIDTIMLGNYEFFSSIFKNLNFFITDRYPSDDWQLLGRFEAKNIRNIQSFKINNPLIWARYIKIEILSHYGNEFYCPISVLKVHGRTMMEEYKLKELEINEEVKKEKKNFEDEFFENFNDDDSITNLSSIEFNLNINEFDKELEFSSNLTTNDNDPISDNDTNLIDNENNTKCIDKSYFSEFEKFIKELKRNESCEPSELFESLKYDNTKTKLLKNSTQIKSKRNEPVTQESIYQSIMKRLSLLESNASLSLLYIEEQSKLLTEAFSKLEKKQSNKFNLLVYALNETYQKQISNFQKSFEDFKLDSDKLFKNQEKVNQNAYEKIDRNFNRLVNQLQFQKKIVLLLFVIVIFLLIYVILTRDTFIEGEYFDEILDDQFSKFNNDSNNNFFFNNDDSRNSIESSFLDQNENSFSKSYSPNNSPSIKRRLKLRISNKLGNSSASTILLDDNHSLGHRKTSSNGSIGIINNLSPTLNSNLRQELSRRNHSESELELKKNRILTPDPSDNESDN